MEVKQSVGICGPFEFYSGNQTAKAGQRLGCFLSFGSSVPPDSQLVRWPLSYPILAPHFTSGLEVSCPQSWGAVFPACQHRGGHTGFWVLAEPSRCHLWAEAGGEEATGDEVPRHCSLSRRKGREDSASLVLWQEQKESRTLGCSERLVALCTSQWDTLGEGKNPIGWMKGKIIFSFKKIKTFQQHILWGYLRISKTKSVGKSIHFRTLPFFLYSGRKL